MIDVKSIRTGDILCKEINGVFGLNHESLGALVLNTKLVHDDPSISHCFARVLVDSGEITTWIILDRGPLTLVSR